MHTDVGQPKERAAAPKAQVRVARAEDFPAIVDIHNWAIAHTAATFTTKPDTLESAVASWKRHADVYPWFVAQAEGAVLGFALASPFSNRCGFAGTAEVTVYVHPEHTGRGIGKALYAALVAALETKGFKTLVAVIAMPNPASERLHESLGFAKVGVLRRVGWKLGRWYDVGYWQLVLNDSDDAPTPTNAMPSICTDTTGHCSESQQRAASTTEGVRHASM